MGSAAMRSGFDRPLWDLLRTAAAPQTAADLRRSCRACPSEINKRLSRWVRAGLVAPSGEWPKRYAMVDPANSPSAPPVIGRDFKARERAPSKQMLMWRAMRVLNTFDLPTLEMISGATRASAREYVKFLCRSEHVRRERRSKGQPGDWSTYRLIRNTGPKSPVIQQTRNPLQTIVLDANTGAQVDVSPGTVNLHQVNASRSKAVGGVG